MTAHRLTLCTALAASLAALSAGGATAQSRCGDSYTVAPGDTLYGIAQQCRVSLSLIYDLNPGVEARDLSVGRSLRLSSDAGSAPAPAPAPDTYEVAEGDTPYSIAQSLGITLNELLAQNEDLDPFRMAVGEILDVPTPSDRGAGFRVSPLAGPPGSTVSITARGLRPDDVVTIGAGPTSSEWTPLRDARVDAEGDLRTEVTLPGWARPGDILTFVVDTDRGMTLKSADFDVIAESAQDDGQTVTLEGRLQSGVECMTLTTPDGDLYSVTSTGAALTPGEYVRVEGTRAEMSFCQQGIATVTASSVTEVPPPDRTGDTIVIEGRVGSASGACYPLITPDGDRYSLTSARAILTPGEYVEVRGTRARDDLCASPDTTVEVDTATEVRPPE